MRDVAGDATTNAASRVRPSEQDLSQIDRPAQDNTWHEAPKINKEAFSKEALKEKAQGFYKGNPKEDAKDIATEGASAVQNGGASTSAAVDTLQQKADENVDQETKDKAQSKQEEYRARAKEYLKKKMPQDRRDQTVWRLKVCANRK